MLNPKLNEVTGQLTATLIGQICIIYIASNPRQVTCIVGNRRQRSDQSLIFADAQSVRCVRTSGSSDNRWISHIYVWDRPKAWGRLADILGDGLQIGPKCIAHNKDGSDLSALSYGLQCLVAILDSVKTSFWEPLYSFSSLNTQWKLPGFVSEYCIVSQEGGQLFQLAIYQADCEKLAWNGQVQSGIAFYRLV